MNFKPNEFFLGLVEFITILLPGAVLSIIILMVESRDSVNHHPIYHYAFQEQTSIIFWIAYVFCSFGLGYFLSSVASGLDPLYDLIRRQTYPYEEDLLNHFRSFSEEKRKSYLKVYEDSQPELMNDIDFKKDNLLTDKERQFAGFKMKYENNFFRRLLGVIFKLEFKIRIDRSYEEARKILNAQPEAVRNATNAYKWAGTILEAHYPTISDQITRIMAASKFFRSIVVVSTVFLLLQILGKISISLWEINALILIFSFREYVVQRQKSVQKTYQSIVTLTYFKHSA